MGKIIIDTSIKEKMINLPWTNVYGLGRSLIALSVLLTFLINDTSTLFRPVLGRYEVPLCDGVSGTISIFCILSEHLAIAKGISVLVLSLVVVGWRPQITGVLHWWINYSFISSAPLVDGGEHVTAVLSFLLIPITLTDQRKWHWSELKPSKEALNKEFLTFPGIIAISFHDLVRIQVAVIYLHAAVGKTNVLEWQNGTAIYYWFTDPIFGLSNWLQPFLMPLIQNPLSLSLINWGAVFLEFMLFAGLFMKNKHKNKLLIVGILFHIMIGLVHGLISFSIVMIGALIFFLRPPSKVFDFSLTNLSYKKLKLYTVKG